MFYNLPLELLSIIYSFDGTYKNIYSKIILEIKEKTPKFYDYYICDDGSALVYIFKCNNKYNKLKNTIYITQYYHRSYKKAFKKAKSYLPI